MAKYHVKKDGTPGVCRAQEGNCPLGDSSQHFSSKEDAQVYADELNERINKRNKLVLKWIENRKDTIAATLYNICEDVDGVDTPSLDKDYHFAREYYGLHSRISENGNIIIEKGIRLQVGSYHSPRIYKYIRMELDPEHLDKMKLSFGKNGKHQEGEIKTYTLGNDGAIEYTKEEIDELNKIEKKVRNKLLRNKYEILSESFDSFDKFVFNDIGNTKGKTIKEVLDIMGEQYYSYNRQFSIMDKEGNKLANGFEFEEKLGEEFLRNTKVDKIKIVEPGGENEDIQLII